MGLTQFGIDAETFPRKGVRETAALFGVNFIRNFGKSAGSPESLRTPFLTQAIQSTGICLSLFGPFVFCTCY